MSSVSVVRAVFSDMDGTLLNSQHKLSGRTLHAIRFLRERGAAFILATGRPAKDVFAKLEDCGAEVDYVISNNGAAIYQADPAPASALPGKQSYTCVRAHCLAPSLVKRLFAVPVPCELADADPTTSLSPHPLVATCIYKGEQWLATCRVGRLGLSYGPTCQPHFMPDLPRQDESFFEGVIHFFFYGPHEHLLGIQSQLQERFPHASTEMEFSFSLPHILDVTAPGVHKGVAVEEVCELVGVVPKDTVAFGDGMNDLAMLQAVGHACVMSNAMPALKEALPHAEVVGHHDADGVAEKLSALFDIPLAR